MSRFLLLLSLCGLVVVPHGNAQMWPRRTPRRLRAYDPYIDIDEGHDRRTPRRLRAFDPYLDVDVVEDSRGLLWGESGSMLLARPGYGYLVNRQIQKRDEYKYCQMNIENSDELVKCMKTQGWYFSGRSGRWHPSEERRREDDKRYARNHKGQEFIHYAPSRL